MSSPASELPVVAPRHPCPCGSGRRYKACHGKGRAAAPAIAPNRRPFAGRADEADLVALREVVPSATAPLTLADGSGREVLLGTALPVTWPAMVRADGRIMLGLQTAARSDDLARDLGQALEAALAAEPGQGLGELPAPAPGASFADLVDPAALEITVHRGFDWWLDGIENPGEQAQQGLAQANANVVPTSRLESVQAAYWCRIGDRTHLRWAMTHDEEPLLDAFARLHHRQDFHLGADTKFIGAFRACGIAIPVWDLAPGTEAAAVEAPAAALLQRLDEALADIAPLTSAEKRTRAGVVSRQLTIR